jgi:hypothetical protein
LVSLHQGYHSSHKYNKRNKNMVVIRQHKSEYSPILIIRQPYRNDGVYSLYKTISMVGVKTINPCQGFKVGIL